MSDKTTPDGGPAFPARPTERLSGGVSITAHHGMTLRDYFAAKAMQALINPKGEDFDRLDEVPEYAYSIADAMLKAREQS